MRVQYDVMVQEFARVLEKKGFTHEMPRMRQSFSHRTVWLVYTPTD